VVNEVSETMGEIVGGVQRVTGIIDEITAATEERRAGIGQMDQVTGMFKLDDGGTGRPPANGLRREPEGRKVPRLA
jgi:hypothetical protein